MDAARHAGGRLAMAWRRSDCSQVGGNKRAARRWRQRRGAGTGRGRGRVVTMAFVVEFAGVILHRCLPCPSRVKIRSSRNPRPIWCWLALALLAGCSADRPPEDAPARPAFAGQQLKVLVVDDAPLTAVVEQLSREWSARTGAQVSVASASVDEVLNSGGESADVLLYPAHLLGALAEQGTLAKLPAPALADEEYRYREIFPLLREREGVWGRDVLAIPFGSATAVLAYRPDLLQHHNKQPPQTWDEYQALAAFFHDRANLGSSAPPAEQPWSGTCEPLADGEAGQLLLSRVAGYVRHPAYFFTLFDEDTMAPRIAEPAFRRALDELAAAARLAGDSPPKLTGQEAFDRLRRGQCAMAIGWTLPRATAGGDAPSMAFTAPIEFAPLPGATTVYLTKGAPESSSLNQAPVLPGWGRLGSVTEQSRVREAAVQFLLALSGEEWGNQVSAASERTSPFRRSQIGAAREWAPHSDVATARGWASAQADNLSRADVLFALRIPGHAEYLAALDRAVAQAVSGEASSAQALEQAAAAWREITDRWGIEKQQQAYRKSVVHLP